MIITIRSVRLTTSGFVVSYHARGTPSDVRATVLDPQRMPPGHELLAAGATVDVELQGDRIVHVRPPRPLPAPYRASVA